MVRLVLLVVLVLVAAPGWRAPATMPEFGSPPGASREPPGPQNLSCLRPSPGTDAPAKDNKTGNQAPVSPVTGYGYS